MNRAAASGLALALVSAVAFVACGWFMAGRITRYYKDTPPPAYKFEPVMGRSFTAFGHPADLTDTVDAQGNHALRVRYGAADTLVRVHKPPVVGRPQLDAYQGWLSLLAFGPLTDGKLDLARESARLVLVWRNAAPGHDDAMGGLVDRNRWTFGVLEFNRDGTLSERLLQFPMKRGTGLDSAGKPRLADISPEVTARVQPIMQRTWEWQAALFVIPKLHISNYRYTADATTALGWTLPAAGFSMLGVLVGVMILGVVATPRAR